MEYRLPLLAHNIYHVNRVGVEIVGEDVAFEYGSCAFSAFQSDGGGTVFDETVFYPEVHK
jgi:hypothetical protein